MKKPVITQLPSGAARHAPPLLFVHGAYVGGWCWAEHFLPHFAAHGYRAHAVDLERTVPIRWPLKWNPHASLSDYVGTIEAAIDALGETPVLIGHSMGGYLVQQYLLRNEAPAAVLMASVPPRGLLTAATQLAFANPLAFQQIQMLQWLGAQTVNSAFGTEGLRQPLFSPHLPDAKVKEYTARARPESPQAIMEMTLPLASGRVPPERLNVLVMGGDLDRLIPASDIHATAKHFATEAVIIDEVGHAMMLDQHWPEVAGSILGWLHEQGL
jgi:pimeloyl-ACP methyl ester carboxylesterase